MNNNVMIDDQENGLIASAPVLKLTSLLYFKEALLGQRYEECAQLVEAAKGFGARQSEIGGIIAEVIRREKGGGQNGANGSTLGRRV